MLTHGHTDRETYTIEGDTREAQADGERDRWTDTRTDRQASRYSQSVSQTDSTDRQTGRGTDRQSGGLIVRPTTQIDRRRDGQTERQTG